jgi:hypothetical protein
VQLSGSQQARCREVGGAPCCCWCWGRPWEQVMSFGCCRACRAGGAACAACRSLGPGAGRALSTPGPGSRRCWPGPVRRGGAGRERGGVCVCACAPPAARPLRHDALSARAGAARVQRRPGGLQASHAQRQDVHPRGHPARVRAHALNAGRRLEHQQTGCGLTRLWVDPGPLVAHCRQQLALLGQVYPA